ncbi:MAG: hypothetical protein JNM56_00920 [Planctomycetia bacterium]|nr:hypothetical protein [Planctomycetia bacterium]
MNTTIETPMVPPQALADLEYALHLLSTGQRDTEFEKRVALKSDEIRREIFAKHGVLNVAVDLIREGRDEE